MSEHRVETDDGTQVTLTCDHPRILQGDTITFAGDTIRNPDRKWWQFWKPRKVMRRWVVK